MIERKTSRSPMRPGFPAGVGKHSPDLLIDHILAEGKKAARNKPRGANPIPPAPRELLPDGISTEAGLSVYLKESSRTPLLTSEQEIQYSKEIMAGNTASRILKNPENSVEDPIKREVLESEIRRGLEAKREMVEANSRLVVSIARRYMNRGIPLDDLIQEGNIGLMRSAEKFDWRKGFRFSTYATWWVRQTVSRSVADQARTIRIPVHVIEDINLLHKAQEQFYAENCREASADELGSLIGMRGDKVRMLFKAAQLPLSMDTPVDLDGDNGAELGDLIPDTSGLGDGLESACQNSQKEEVREVLNTLEPRERAVIILRYGLNDGKPKTLEEIGEALGVTRERIRQLELRAIGELRKPFRARRLAMISD